MAGDLGQRARDYSENLPAKGDFYGLSASKLALAVLLPIIGAFADGAPCLRLSLVRKLATQSHC